MSPDEINHYLNIIVIIPISLMPEKYPTTISLTN